MRTPLSLAAVLVALAAAHAAPTPKDKPAAVAIDGKYTLASVSSPADRAQPVNDPRLGGFRPGRARSVSDLVGPAVITKTDILLEGRSTGWDNFGQPLPPSTLEMRYTIDATKTPMTIDIDTIDQRGKKKTSLGLVEMANDRLVIAVGKEGGERPKNLDEEGDTTVYYFRKAAPAVKPEVRIVAMTVGKEAEAEKQLNKLLEEGFELVSTNAPVAPDAKSSPTTVHFILKRTAKP